MGAVYYKMGKAGEWEYGGILLNAPEFCPACNKEIHVRGWKLLSCIQSESEQKVYKPGSSSYSMAKGIVGTAILGPVGALAGINGKKTAGSSYTVGRDRFLCTIMCPCCSFQLQVEESLRK